jgi:hypothetical protein
LTICLLLVDSQTDSATLKTFRPAFVAVRVSVEKPSKTTEAFVARAIYIQSWRPLVVLEPVVCDDGG